MNTGRVSFEPRVHTSPCVLRALADIYFPGTHLMPVEGCRAEVVRVDAGCFCMVVAEETDTPLLTLAVAEDGESADRLWPDLVRYYETVRSCPGFESLPQVTQVRPEIEPWYVSVTMLTNAHEVLFLRDFCRHFAWGWIDRQHD